jgi:PIN domain nuclease of toxin-antitoxin system
MTVLDAFAVIAGLVDEPARAEVEELLVDKVDRPMIDAVSVGEVVDCLSRVGGVAPEDAAQRIVWLRKGGLEVVDADAFLGATAGAFRAKFYNAQDRPVSMADCIALVTAIRYGQRLATADPALAAVARECEVEVVALPDSQGQRP